jgi:DNA mismatch repair protein MutS
MAYNGMPTLVEEYFGYVEQQEQQHGPKTAVLLQCGSFFELYGVGLAGGDVAGSKIVEASHVCSLRVGVKAQKVSLSGAALQWVKRELPIDGKCPQLVWYQAGFQLPYLDRYVAYLTTAGWTVCVYTQTPTKQPHTGQAFDRELKQVFTPGTTFIDDDTAVTNTTVCVWIEIMPPSLVVPRARAVHGCASVDIYTGETRVFERIIDPVRGRPQDYAEVAHFIEGESPREVRVIVTDARSPTELPQETQEATISALTKAMRASPALVKRIAFSDGVASCRKQTVRETELRRYFPASVTADSCALAGIREAETCAGALVLLLSMMERQCPSLVEKLRPPVMQASSRFVSLPNQSLEQLNVTGSRSKVNHSLLALVRAKASTVAGRRRISRELLNPIKCPKELEGMYESTAMYLSATKTVRTECASRLHRVCDIDKLYRKMVLGRADLGTLLELRSSVEAVRDLLLWVRDTPEAASLCAAMEASTECARDGVLKAITSVVGSGGEYESAAGLGALLPHGEIAQSFRGRVFAPEACPEIAAMCDAKDATEKCVSALSCHLGTLLALKTGSVEVCRPNSGDAFFQTTRRRAAALITRNTALRVTVPGEDKTMDVTTASIIPVARGAGEKRKLQLPAFDSLFASLSLADERIETANSEAFNKVSAALIAKRQDFNVVSGFVAAIDVSLARAALAEDSAWTRPVLLESDSSSIAVEGLRHPLIERCNHDELYVPNDLSVGGPESGMLVFGTNAVGKSSLVKSVGICVVLAQSGFFVPADRLRIAPFTQIFTRILGNDDLFRGLSTFAVEMLELNTVLVHADKNSLVLGDELCSGTETTSAVAIFAAGLEHLMKVGSAFIFATHLHEIARNQCGLSLEQMQLKHLAVQYNADTDELEYIRKLRDGPGAAIYGLEVCRALHMPTEFTERAGEIRRALLGDGISPLHGMTARYNAQKIVGTCEVCGKKSSETHHLQHQKGAVAGRVVGGRTHHAANLMALCSSCHDAFHKQKGEHMRVRAGGRYQITGAGDNDVD